MINTFIEEIRKTLSQIKKTQKEKIQILDSVLSNYNFSSNSCIAYFTESISLSSEPSDENVVIGNFQVINIGHTSIHQPILLIKIKSDSNFNFSGKYAPIEGQDTQGIYEWERIKTKGDMEKEYWLRPLKVNKIAPGEKLVYSSFQLKFPACDNLVLSMDGFVYYEENHEGVRSLNSINFTI
ncbi:hypothetical protein ACQKP0_11870 [Heyndrickxia sp. NPDC080065]|uniref:hypothetical protein n=1 Tax=Heyndrickxia sp. NPDC080065 TaxID=3390568 RepID=UPI003D06C808